MVQNINKKVGITAELVNSMKLDNRLLWMRIAILAITLMLGTGCASNETGSGSDQGAAHGDDNVLSLPSVEPVQLADRPLRVVATTSIIGDVVAHVAGDGVQLSTLMAGEQDPHSYEPSAGDLKAAAEADVLFVNGWDLEESLVDDLATIAGDTPVVAVGANLEPLETGEGDQDRHSAVDPHTWFSVPNVEQWVKNIVQILGDLDPDNAARYEENGQAYLLELEDIDQFQREEIAKIPAEKRILVTNHGVFNYFAEEYGLRVVGTVLPSTSTQAEPSAGEMADLIKVMKEAGVCTIFTDVAANDDLAKTAAAELDNCANVAIVPLYTGSLGPEGSEADSYIGMLRVNLDRIVGGLE